MGGGGRGNAGRNRGTGYALCVAVAAIGAGATILGVAVWESYREGVPGEGGENWNMETFFIGAFWALIALLVLGGVCGAIAGRWRLGTPGLLASVAAAATSAGLVGVVTGSASGPSGLSFELVVLVAALVGGYMLGLTITRPREPNIPTPWPGPGSDGTGRATGDGPPDGPRWPTSG